MLQKHRSKPENNYLNFDMEIWDGMVNVAEEVKEDVVKAALDAEIITTEAKLICVAKLILERIFTPSESSGFSPDESSGWMHNIYVCFCL
jgi:hypothetical protein